MYRQSSKLANVLYDIRGPVLEEAEAMEAKGHTILKLNIGNPAPFGFEAPEAIVHDMVKHFPSRRGTRTRVESSPPAAPSSSTTRPAASTISAPTRYSSATASASSSL